MKLKFKKQAFQTRAMEAVVDCFKGQPNTSGISYRIDPGIKKTDRQGYYQQEIVETPGFKNTDIALTEPQILENIQSVQRYQNLSQCNTLVKTEISPINLDIEMETGTGKTYCYIKTIFEMNQRYGWSKFIIVVPSIAIREGVYKSFEITAEHFLESYGKKIKFFIYNSKQLHNLESFSSDAGINVMVINVQAFNARGADNRRIYEELDDFQSRRPIDVIKANRPIMILDEPQKMEGSKTLDSLKEFNPLMILRYSATHKTIHNKVHRLDALDAYNQKLVKKIAVRGISVKGLSGANAYLYLESIEVSKLSPVARIEMEIKQNIGIKRITRKLEKGDNLFDLSNELDQYKGFVISNINAVTDTVEFTNGVQLTAGEATGDVNVTALRRIQIREAIRSQSDSLSARPRIADAAYFTGKILRTDSGYDEVTPDMAAGIEFYLIQNGYVDRKKNIAQAYHDAVKNNTLSPLPDDLMPYKEQIFQLIDSLYSDVMLPEIENDRGSKTNPLNTNFEKKEFQELWHRINKKAAYSVHFDSSELIGKCVKTLDNELRVAPLQYTIQKGEQDDKITYDQIKSSDVFSIKETTTKEDHKSINSLVKYDVIGKVAESVQLTRKTVSEILSKIQKAVFEQFKSNPENFISETTRLINEQKATVIIEHLTYDTISETHGIDIFTDGQSKQDFTKAGEPLKRHIYDYVITDSKTERSFVDELDTSAEVVVYAKLPKGFFIPTPVGNYNPDWAITFKEGRVKHIYFVAETKGSMSSMELREIEKTKIECARKFFDEINRKINTKNVKYDVISSYGALMNMVGIL